jgi:mannose-6-phosphate isomerase-like protein (cupin superfamily)
MKRFQSIIAILFNIQLISIAQTSSKDNNWIQLFNGIDLTGWDIKITGSDLNVNYKNTFIVENGILKANYSEYSTFKGEYGHLYYQTPYSHYILRLEYRFTGVQVLGGESWNVRNSGVMIHSQSAKSVGKDQSFPVSLEVQFLGGLGNGVRATANLCTPGTTVEYAGKTVLEHIINSKSKTYDGDQWVTVDVVVLGDSVIHHIMEGDTVLTYFKPKIGGGFVHKDYTFETAKVPNPEFWIKKENTPLKSGYIALQAESHPIEFRRVDLLPLRESIDIIFNNPSVIVNKISNLPSGNSSQPTVCQTDRIIIFVNRGFINTLDFRGKILKKDVKPGEPIWINKGRSFKIDNIGADYLSYYEIQFKNWNKTFKSFSFPKNDPVSIDPMHYKTTFENDKTRVVYASFPPGAKIPMHVHNNERVILFLSEHPLKLTLPSGESFNIKEQAGSAYFGGPATHAEENISDIEVNTVFIDLKK